MSLRNRIFLWYALSITILVIILTFTAQQVMIGKLRSSIDERLIEITETLSGEIISTPVSSAEDYQSLIKQLTEQELNFLPAVIRISDAEHNILATFGDITDLMIPIMDRQLLLPQLEEGRFSTIETKGYDALRLYTISVYNPDTLEFIAILQTGDSMASLSAAQGELWEYSSIVALCGIMVALIFGLFILQHGLQPLYKIINQVKDIGTKNLKTGIKAEKRPPELQQLADNINNTLQRLDKAFKAREIFIAGISHDLKTPLTVLQGQIEVMQMQPNLDKETTESIERMSREIHRLVRMTNNLLLNAQLEAIPGIAYSNVNLKDLIEDVARDMRLLSSGLDFNISAQNAVIVQGDYDLLKPMLINIVDNAFKFTPRNGSVKINLGSEEQFAVITIKDTGSGISKKHLPHITEPFYKIKSAQKHEGTGLGLAIVKQIVDIHNGRLKIQSRKGAGTTITIYLPLFALKEDTGHGRSG
jgi:two-component system OmpR family sensor kinase